MIWVRGGTAQLQASMRDGSTDGLRGTALGGGVDAPPECCGCARSITVAPLGNALHGPRPMRQHAADGATPRLGEEERR